MNVLFAFSETLSASVGLVRLRSQDMRSFEIWPHIFIWQILFAIVTVYAPH